MAEMDSLDVWGTLDGRYENQDNSTHCYWVYSTSKHENQLNYYTEFLLEKKRESRTEGAEGDQRREGEHDYL